MVFRIYFSWGFLSLLEAQEDDDGNDKYYDGDNHVDADTENHGCVVSAHILNEESAERISSYVQGKDTAMPQLPGFVRPQQEQAHKNIPDEFIEESWVY